MSGQALEPLVGYALVSLLALYFLKRFIPGREVQGTLPPGPPGVPILGNLFDFPSSNNWEVYAKWEKKYGDIVHVNLAGTHIVVLNSVDVTSALFDGRSAVYSHRPHFHFLSETVGCKDMLPFQPDGPRMREHRRLFAQVMGSKSALERFTPLLESETRKFLYAVLNNPGSEVLPDHIRKLVGAVILNITYGYEVGEGKDDLVDLIRQSVDAFSEAGTPGAHLVDTFPWLDKLPSWFPGTGFKVKAAHIRQTMLNSLNVPYNWTREQMKLGIARPSLVANSLEQEVSAQQEHEIKWAALAMYGGGADTTVSAIHSFILFMVHYPEVQAKAQAEIDAVTSCSRLPTLTDRSSLPYVAAVVKEVWRCAVILPQAGARQLFEHDVYNGYYFPRGTIILSNIWYILRDPRTYTSPETFDPTRFLGPNPNPDPREVFGFGRRICPGRHLADNNLFLAAAMLLATFDITKATDAAGQVIDPPLEWVGDIVTHPRPFNCSIKPRTSQLENLVRVEAEIA